MDIDILVAYISLENMSLPKRSVPRGWKEMGFPSSGLSTPIR